jgi:outer membrane protein assembly factor BamE (lipoprotein component of BamABCDE complex)
MTKRIRTAAILAALMLAACAGSPFQWSDVRRISPGMTPQEVTNIIGTPTSVAARGDVLRYVWVHVNGLTAASRTLALEFKDGKLVAVPPLPDGYQ